MWPYGEMPRHQHSRGSGDLVGPHELSDAASNNAPEKVLAIVPSCFFKDFAAVLNSVCD